MDKSSINSSIILAQKQSLRYFDIKSQLNEENFIGIWTSKNPEDVKKKNNIFIKRKLRLNSIFLNIHLGR